MHGLCIRHRVLKRTEVRKAETYMDFLLVSLQYGYAL